MASTMSKSDPLNTAVYDGIKRGIRVCFDNECFGSAVILTYSGIDTMAYLGMPENQSSVVRADFIAWCDRYMRFPGREQLDGAELYGARCAMVHTYGVESRMSKRGHCRILGYMDRSSPPIRYDASVRDDFALVSIESLIEAFFKGIDDFLVDLFSKPARAAVAERRVRQLVVPYHINGE